MRNKGLKIVSFYPQMMNSSLPFFSPRFLIVYMQTSIANTQKNVSRARKRAIECYIRIEHGLPPSDGRIDIRGKYMTVVKFVHGISFEPPSEAASLASFRSGGLSVLLQPSQWSKSDASIRLGIP